MASLSTQKPLPLSEIRKKVNFAVIIDSRAYFNRINGYSDDAIKNNWHNINIGEIQSFSSRRLFKLFAANDSSFSSSVYTHLRMMVDKFTVTAYKPNKTLYKIGQKYIDELLTKLNYEDDWNEGFSLANTLLDQIGRIGRNILTSDQSAAALFIQVNDKTYEVEKFVPIDCDRVFFKKTIGFNRMIPYIYENERKVPLDVINFLWQPLDPDAGEYAGNNPLRPALRNVFTKTEFLENLRKVLKNQAWPKIKVVLDEQAVIGLASPEDRVDGKKLITFLNAYIADVKDQLTNIEADQNLVVYDTIKEMTFLESKNNFDPNPIAKLLDSEAISSLKAPPSTVGKGGSTKTGEGLASAELVIFRRTIKALRRIFETTYSRAFTLAMRLKGLPGYAKFREKEFTLRPPEEAAQFDQIRQDSIINAWIYGSIGEEEKNLKIRQIHDLEGAPPKDASIQKDLVERKSNGQTERGAIAEGEKEQSREETRKKQKAGNDKK